MRRLILLLLCAVLTFSILGCVQDTPKLEEPVSFYYRVSIPENDLPDSMIGIVTAEGAGMSDDLPALLNEYLRGTGEEGFETTFPASTKVLELSIEENIANVQMNASLARLEGIDLTIACACITMTVIGLTGVSSVCIRASNATLDGAPQIIMDANCLTLLDTSTPETT